MIGVQSHTLDESAKPSLCGTLRVPREHGAREKVLNQGMLWNVSWSWNPPWSFFILEQFWSCTLFTSRQSKGRIWVRCSHSNGTLVTKITFEMLFHLGTFFVRYIFLFHGSLMADISEHTSVQNLPPSSMFPRHPKGATGKASLTHPKYDFGHLSYFKPRQIVNYIIAYLWHKHIPNV